MNPVCRKAIMPRIRDDANGLIPWCYLFHCVAAKVAR